MNPLVRSQAEYEAVFERITRLSLEYLATVPERPSFPDVTGRGTQAWFSRELPEHGIGEAALDDLTKVIDGCRPNSPRFFGYVFGSGEPVAAAADLLASVLNQNTTAWRSGPSAITLERIVVGWLVLRFTWDDVVRHPEYVIQTLRETWALLLSRPGRGSSR